MQLNVDYPSNLLIAQRSILTRRERIQMVCEARRYIEKGVHLLAQSLSDSNAHQFSDYNADLDMLISTAISVCKYHEEYLKGVHK